MSPPKPPKKAPSPFVRTPGPWRRAGMVQDSILIAGEDDVVVALVMTQDHELDVTLDGEQQANAAVIGCADRMLEALEDINRHGIGSGFFQGTPRLMALINEARGAKV